MLSQFFSPVHGGEERSVESLGVELAAHGHEVAVATLRVGRTLASEEIGGVRIHRLGSFFGRFGAAFQESERRHLPPVPDPELVAGLRRVLAAERPDVVHAHNWIAHSFLPLKRGSGVPLVLSLHDYSLVCATKRLVRFGAACSGPGPAKCVRCSANHYGLAKGPAIASSLLVTSPALRRRVDMFLPVSTAVAEALELAQRGLPFEVVPNLISERGEADPGDADPTLVQRLPEDGFLLFLGDMSDDKGARVLLDAHASLEGAPPLVFVGRPLDSGAEPQRANVHILGAWPHASALEAVRRCSMLVVPSLVPETFGMAALEAMALGRPVVASRSGGLAELIADGESGMLVPPGSVTALADAIATLVGDPARREAMGGAGKARSALYSAREIVPRVERVYNRLVAAPSGATSNREVGGAAHVDD